MCLYQFLWVVLPYGIAKIVDSMEMLFSDKKCSLLLSTKLEDNDCSICIDKMYQGQLLVKVDHCNHTFHFDCVEKWNHHYGRTCPLCRTPIGFIV